jgi:hypothetical protein
MVHLGVRPQIHARCQLSRKPRGSCVSSSLHVDSKKSSCSAHQCEAIFGEFSFPGPTTNQSYRHDSQAQYLGGAGGPPL